MRSRGLTNISIAVVLGGVSVLLVRGLMKDGPAGAPRGPATATVVVAKAPIPFGIRITADMLREVAWPQESLPEGAFTQIGQVISDRGARVSLNAIEANEPIFKNRVSEPGGHSTLSSMLGEGMRALTIRVNDVQGVAGFVLPNDRVDVLLTRREGDHEAMADIVLQNVKVLGVDQEVSDKKDKPQVARAVTLEVDPASAQKLTLASSVGTLSLALRNRAYAGLAELRTVRLEDLKPHRPGTAPTRTEGRAPSSDLASVAIVRGLDIDTVQVARGGNAAAPP